MTDKPNVKLPGGYALTTSNQAISQPTDIPQGYENSYRVVFSNSSSSDVFLTFTVYRSDGYTVNALNNYRIPGNDAKEFDLSLPYGCGMTAMASANNALTASVFVMQRGVPA